MKKCVSVVSGGMDSVTMAYYLKDLGYEQTILSFDYGQRHVKELEFAKKCAENLKAPFYIMDLSTIKPLLSGSSLTDDIDVPDGHYASENMKITVVPNRNAIMLSIAFGMAISHENDYVAIAAHSGDHFIYPDCRPSFLTAFNEMQKHSMDGFGEAELLTPFVNFTKSQIVEVGNKLNVPFNETWSCYKGKDVHCGTCGTCVERKEAFELANVDDFTKYLN